MQEQKTAPKMLKAAVIYNPSKPEPWKEIRKQIATTAALAGFQTPRWIPTSKTDPGAGQAREALANGAALVIAAGGDGTVRMVAGELAGSRVPLGILPLGTGNLFARNLKLPIGDPAAAARIAFFGTAKRIDLAWVALKQRATPAYTTLNQHPFLVVGGTGFDAETMDATDSKLKKIIGLWAYFQAAIPKLFSRRFTATISAPNLSRAVTTRAKSVLWVNCPELNNGLVLDPDADPGDGVIDLNVLEIQNGLLGWADLARRIAMSWAGLRSRTKGTPVKPIVGGIRKHPVRECTVILKKPQKVQVDGDVVGVTQEVHAWVQPDALRVKAGPASR